MEEYLCGQCMRFGTRLCGATGGGNPPCHLFEANEKLTNDPVNPNHYKKTYAKEVIDLLAASLTPEEFKGYCKGNMLKYRFRAGYKGDRDEDLKKSNWYQDKLKEVSDED